MTIYRQSDWARDPADCGKNKFSEIAKSNFFTKNLLLRQVLPRNARGDCGLVLMNGDTITPVLRWDSSRESEIGSDTVLRLRLLRDELDRLPRHLTGFFHVDISSPGFRNSPDTSPFLIIPLLDLFGLLLRSCWHIVKHLRDPPCSEMCQCNSVHETTWREFTNARFRS